MIGRITGSGHPAGQGQSGSPAAIAWEMNLLWWAAPAVEWATGPLQDALPCSMDMAMHPAACLVYMYWLSRPSVRQPLYIDGGGCGELGHIGVDDMSWSRPCPIKAGEQVYCLPGSRVLNSNVPCWINGKSWETSKLMTWIGYTAWVGLNCCLTRHTRWCWRHVLPLVKIIKISKNKFS